MGARMVIGQRISRDDPALSKFTSQTMHELVRRFVDARYPASGFDFFVVDKAIAEQFCEMDSVNSGMQIQLVWLCPEYVAIPYERRKRAAGKSSWGFRRKVDLALNWFAGSTTAPLRLLWLLGALLFLVALGLFAGSFSWTDGRPPSGSLGVDVARRSARHLLHRHRRRVRRQAIPRSEAPSSFTSSTRWTETVSERLGRLWEKAMFPLDRRRFYVVYSLLFAVLMVLVYGWFYLNGKSSIWTSDSLSQFYSNLLYLREWVRGILDGVLAGEGLAIPLWDMRIGHGEDVLNVVNWRPLNFVSILSPREQLELYCWLRFFLCPLSGRPTVLRLRQKTRRRLPCIDNSMRLRVRTQWNLLVLPGKASGLRGGPGVSSLGASGGRENPQEANPRRGVRRQESPYAEPPISTTSLP